MSKIEDTIQSEEAASVVSGSLIILFLIFIFSVPFLLEMSESNREMEKRSAIEARTMELKKQNDIVKSKIVIPPLSKEEQERTREMQMRNAELQELRDINKNLMEVKKNQDAQSTSVGENFLLGVLFKLL